MLWRIIIQNNIFKELKMKTKLKIALVASNRAIYGLTAIKLSDCSVVLING